MKPLLPHQPAADQVPLTPVNTPVLDMDPQWAWAEFVPDDRRPWSLALAGHLYRRAGFGADWEQLQRALSDGPRPAIDQLVRPAADMLADETVLDQDEEAAGKSSGMESLRAWWLRRMIQTRCPLREKMTLFWHSHFGVSNARVNDSQLMMRHVCTLRTHALGSYRTLLDSLTQDPAVFVAWGADTNRKSDPNERFSRQLMERLSLGPGHYGDEDVREAARALTGWFVLRGRLRYFPHEFDEGSKRVLGQEGPWKPEDIVRIVLQQPAAPRLVARRLFRWLVSEVAEPSDTLIEPMAQMLGEPYHVGQVVETMLRSNLFFSDHAVRRRIKSPVEYALSIVKAFGTLVPTLPLGDQLTQLGQELYSPPTTRGWVGGPHWINAATLLGRTNLAAGLLATTGPVGGKLDPAALTRQYAKGTPAEQVEFFLSLLVQHDVDPAVRSALQETLERDAGQKSRDALRQLTYQIVTLPEFQLC